MLAMELGSIEVKYNIKFWPYEYIIEAFHKVGFAQKYRPLEKEVTEAIEQFSEDCITCGSKKVDFLNGKEVTKKCVRCDNDW